MPKGNFWGFQGERLKFPRDYLVLPSVNTGASGNFLGWRTWGTFALGGGGLVFGAGGYRYIIVNIDIRCFSVYTGVDLGGQGGVRPPFPPTKQKKNRSFHCKTGSKTNTIQGIKTTYR